MFDLKQYLTEHRTVLNENEVLGDFMTLQRELKDFATQDRFAAYKLDPSAPDYDSKLEQQVKPAIQQVRQALNKLESLLARYK